MDMIENSLDASDRKILKGEASEEILTPALTIVEDDQSLGSPEDNIASPSAIIENSIDTPDADDMHYEFREDGVTYRVVQVRDNVGQLSSSSVSQHPTIVPTQQPVQAIYSDAANGGIYVIGAQHQVFPINSCGHKTYLPRLEDHIRPTVTRNDKRRATHNEVERRRRDKINSWIVKLGSIIPDCKAETVKGGFEPQSKGGILAKACDYITELRESNERLMSYAKENEQLLTDVDSLVQKCDHLKSENDKLRSLLRQNGIPTV